MSNNPRDLWTESDIVNAIRNAIDSGAVFPFPESESQKALDTILGTGKVSKESFDHLSLILPFLSIEFDYLWSPYDAERAALFASLQKPTDFHVNEEFGGV